MKRKFLQSSLLALTGVCLIAGSAFALPILTLSDGSNTITIDDSSDPYGAGDGAVLFSGWLGMTNFVFTGGSSYPANGDEDYPQLHLGAGVTQGDAEITFTLTDTFSSLDPAILGWVTEFRGAGDGDVALSVTLNGTSLADFDEFGPDQISTFVPSASSYEFVLTGTIQGSGTTIVADFKPVPEPATMLLFGTGLAGLAGVVRRKKK